MVLTDFESILKDDFTQTKIIFRFELFVPNHVTLDWIGVLQNRIKKFTHRQNISGILTEGF